MDLVLTATQLGYDAIGIADRNTLAGVVRLHTEAKAATIRPIIGARLDLVDGPSFLAYPQDRRAYARLSRLLSKGKMQTLDKEWQGKGECHLSLEMIIAEQAGIQLIVIPPDNLEKELYPAPYREEEIPHLKLVGGDKLVSFADLLPTIAKRIPSLDYVAVSYLYRGNDVARINELDRLAKKSGLSIMATNDVHYHEAKIRPL